MTTVAFIGDSHFSETSRFRECIALHDFIARDLAARGVDLVVHCGDVFDAKSTPEERRAVADWLRAVAETAPVVLVRGNHDHLGDLALLGRLRTRHPVIVEEACGVHVVAGVAVAAVAWPRKAELLAGAAASIEDGAARAGDALRAVLRGLGDELAVHGGPRVLAAHAMVRGSLTSTGQPLVGCDMEIGLDDLALARAHIVALGHVHLPQDLGTTPEGAPIVYTGSPRRTAFGELEEKSYVVAEFEHWDGPVAYPTADLWACTSWDRVAVPATPMLLLEAEHGADGWVTAPWASPDFVAANAEIRIRVMVDADRRDAARKDAEKVRATLLAAGASSIKIEEVVRATTRARAPEIARASTVAEKLGALWRGRGDVPDETRRARLLARLAELEGS